MNVFRVADSRLKKMSGLFSTSTTDNPHIDNINILTTKDLVEECVLSAGFCYEILTKKNENASRYREICITYK